VEEVEREREEREREREKREKQPFFSSSFFIYC